MTAGAPTRTSAVVRVLAAVGIAEGFAIIVLNAVNGASLREAVVNYSVACVVFAWTTTPIAALILLRHPGHRVGWLLMWTGVATPAQVVVAQVAVLIRPAGAVAFSDLGPIAQVLEWLPFWAWTLMVFPFITLLPLHFPDGRLPTGRWRGVAVTAVVVILALAVGQGGGYWAWHPDAVLEEGPAWTPLIRVADVAFPAFGLVALACLASVVVRYRRAAGVERQQMKLLLYSVAVTVPVMTACLIAIDASGETFWPILGVSVLIVPIPLAIGIAILRHGLFDVDLVINRTIVFAVLAAFITAVYAAVVVGLGALLPTSDLVLSIAATSLVAMAFEPVRARVQHWANVAVFGRRATPYEVLARMTSRVGAAVDADAALGEAAVLLAEGTGAAQATVWLRRGGLLHPIASAPDDPTRRLEALPVLDAEPDLGITADLVVPVRHDGALVGALSLSKRPGEGVSTADRRLVEELAGQASLVLATTRLRARLHARLTELRESRRRLVAAQDRARRALERNLHDGAQQELVALKIKLGLARTIAQREGAEAIIERLGGAVEAADRVIEDLRDLARGIYPPLLESEGLPAALTAQTRKLDVAVTVLDRGTGRHAREVEATAYFCALEALANTQRHAAATAAQVLLEQLDDDDGLVVTITDDGRGFDPDRTPFGDGLTHMTDRVDACGGTLAVTARPGHGTSVRLVLPGGGSAVAAAAGDDDHAALVGQAAASVARRSSSTNGSKPPLETKSSAPAERA